MWSSLGINCTIFSCSWPPSDLPNASRKQVSLCSFLMSLCEFLGRVCWSAWQSYVYVVLKTPALIQSRQAVTRTTAADTTTTPVSECQLLRVWRFESMLNLCVFALRSLHACISLEIIPDECVKWCKRPNALFIAGCSAFYRTNICLEHRRLCITRENDHPIQMSFHFKPSIKEQEAGRGTKTVTGRQQNFWSRETLHSGGGCGLVRCGFPNCSNKRVQECSSGNKYA